MMEQLPQLFLADHTLYVETGQLCIPSESIDLCSHLDSTLICSKVKGEENTIESVIDQLKNTLSEGISRKRADRWRRRWFRVYALRGQL